MRDIKELEGKTLSNVEKDGDSILFMDEKELKQLAKQVKTNNPPRLEPYPPENLIEEAREEIEKRLPYPEMEHENGHRTVYINPNIEKMREKMD